jgi:hypothetical protein
MISDAEHGTVFPRSSAEALQVFPSITRHMHMQCNVGYSADIKLSLSDADSSLACRKAPVSIL